MATVYFKPVASYQQTQDISDGARRLLQTLVERENVTLAPVAPLKVHFGEKGNQTFIGAKNFDGIIDYLRAQHVETCYMETNVLYRGERQTRAQHVKLAERHGFTQIPVVIADGETGDDYDEVEIGQKRFTRCKIGREIAKQEQLIVVSHFDEGKPSRAARLAILDDVHGGHRTVLSECLAEIVLRRRMGQVAHVDTLHEKPFQ